jgi:hypothetical protein
VEWATPVGTAIGAIVGVGAALLGDRVRWRRETKERDREALRLVYVTFLKALAITRDELSRTSADVSSSGEERALAAHRAFREQEIYAKQYQFEISAPSEIVELGLLVTERLVDYRDAVISGATRSNEACTLARQRLTEAGRALIGAMRSTLARTS